MIEATWLLLQLVENGKDVQRQLLQYQNNTHGGEK